MNEETVKQVIEMGKTFVMTHGLQLVYALLIFIIGRWIAKISKNIIVRLMTRRKLDTTVISFISSILYGLILAIVLIAALNQMGIETTSFIAVLGAAGLAIGLALQGSLSNFAAGFLLIVLRPFKGGDFIEGAGVMGTVEEIQIFHTNLKSPDNKLIIVPNSKLVNGNIINYSAKDTRRVDMLFGVGYDDDLKKVKAVLTEIVSADDRILAEPKPVIALTEFADSSINLVVRPWVKTPDYWPVYFDLMEKVKERFDQEGISIPFPQRDIHLYSQNT